MAQVLRSDLRDAIIFRADLPATEPRRVSDDQLNTLINRSLLRLQGILMTFHSEDYFFATLPFGLGAGTSVSVGSFVGKIIHVMWRAEPFDSNAEPRHVRLSRMKEEDWEARGQDLVRKWSKSQLPKWWVGATTGTDLGHLNFSPASTVTESILIIYQKELRFDDDTTPEPIDFAWEEWIVLDCLLAIRQRDKQDGTDIFNERERTEQRIREQAPERFKDDRNTVLNLESGFDLGTRFPLRLP